MQQSRKILCKLAKSSFMARKQKIKTQLKLEYAVGGVEKVKSKKSWIDELMF